MTDGLNRLEGAAVDPHAARAVHISVSKTVSVGSTRMPVGQLVELLKGASEGMTNPQVMVSVHAGDRPFDSATMTLTLTDELR